MVLDTVSGFPPDIRVEKQARALTRAGFNVHLLTRQTATEQLPEEQLGYGLQVHRCPVDKAGLLRRQYYKLTLIFKPWLNVIDDFIRTTQPDILHVHDFTMVPTVLHVARQYNLPVVADLHENMPAALRVYRHNKNIIARLALACVDNYYLWRHYEKKYLAHCKRIIVVVPEAAKRLTDCYHLPQNKIVVISNTEDQSTFDIGNPDQAIIEKYRPYWTALYIGGIGPHRGIDTSVRAAGIAGRQIDNFKLLIVGIQKPQHRKQIISLARQANALDYIEMVNWVPASQVNSYIAAARVCLVPHNNFEHSNTTVPHKLFQYMITQKPVLVSSCPPLQRIVNDAHCGLVFKADDPVDMARKFTQLNQMPPDEFNNLGNNGHHAALTKYSWQHDAQRLINMYRQIR